MKIIKNETSKERLKRLLKERYGEHGFQQRFINDLNDYPEYMNLHPEGKDCISPKKLSESLNKNREIKEEEWKWFSKVLGYPIDFLMCKDNNIIPAQLYEKRDDEIYRFLKILSQRRFSLYFNLSQISESDSDRRVCILRWISDHFSLTQNGKNHSIDYLDFYNWYAQRSDTILLIIDKLPLQYAINEIVLIDNAGRKLSMKKDDFFKMILDINMSIQDIISTRMKYWFDISTYDSMNDFSSVSFPDL